MSKIDEVYKKHVLNQGNENTDYSMVFQVLDELKPYVELAEMCMDMIQFATYPKGPDYPEELTMRNLVFLNKIKQLIKQIKEQSK